MHIDMPLHELENYQGKSPKPTDFDDYWTRTLAELNGQSLDYALVPEEIKSVVADCYHLYFKGVDGAKVHCKYVKPKNIQMVGAGLAVFHGYSVDSGDWLLGKGQDIQAKIISAVPTVKRNAVLMLQKTQR
ncbi:acetylxylan esterase [Bacillus sp. FSL K6-3431]|uniref:acetylxylan esterase n=1 Tax=Bacillus sp. FSL K6-3431 TaxID=2921500 RepID=UPI0030F512B8